MEGSAMGGAVLEAGVGLGEGRLAGLQAAIAPSVARLAGHSLYRSLASVEDLRWFMEAHVFAVWDFMSLLKALQGGLTCVTVPWVPRALPESRRLINEIVLGEESDVFEGKPLSHFEIYRMAMGQCGASTAAMDGMLRMLGRGVPVSSALRQCGAPGAAAAFVGETFEMLGEGKLHVTAAAFTFGREDLIPGMFRGFVRALNAQLAGSLSTFIWYLERHIEVDGEEHGPMALRMMAELCGEDAGRWAEAERAAVRALEARLGLWDGILAGLPSRG